MTRSLGAAPDKATGEQLLVGLDGGGRLLDVEVERHVRVVLQDPEHLGESGHTELAIGGGPSPVRVRAGGEARSVSSPPGTNQ